MVWMWLLCALLGFAYFLWETSSIFRYYLKFTVYYLILWITSGFILIYALMHPFNIDNTRLVKLVIAQAGPILGMDIKVRGIEHLCSDEALVIVCNHQSSLDVIPMMEIWPERCAPLAKKELRYVGWFGFAAWLCGCIFIDRFNRASNREELARTIDEVKNDKLKLWVFAEGTRNHKSGLLPFKKGAFHIAIQAQIPIVPVVISSYKPFYSKSEHRFDSGGKVIVEVLPPIATTSMSSDNVSELSDSTRELMLETLESISEEAAIAFAKG